METKMAWDSIWQDLLFGLSHGGRDSWRWDAVAGAAMVVLGLWFGFEIWCRPYRRASVGRIPPREELRKARRFPARPIPAKFSGYQTRPISQAGWGEEPVGEWGDRLEPVRLEWQRLEAISRIAAGKRERCIERICLLQDNARQREADHEAALGEVWPAERRCRDWEKKLQFTRMEVKQASREVEEWPSAVSALRENDALFREKEAAAEAEQAATELIRARERLRRAEAGLEQWKVEMVEAEAAAELADREAQDAADAAMRARVVVESAEGRLRAVRKGRRKGGSAKPAKAEPTTEEVAPERVAVTSTAALAAAKLLSRDSPADG